MIAIKDVIISEKDREKEGKLVRENADKIALV